MRRLLTLALAAAALLPGCTFVHAGQGVFGSNDDDEAVAALGASGVRVGFDIGTPCSTLQPVVQHYADKGARVLLLAEFYGSIPTVPQAQSLLVWESCVGPQSTWCSAQASSAVCPDTIEFGNETSYGYQYPAGNPYADLATRAQAYGQRFVQARTQLGSSMKLLAQADDGGSGSSTWVNGLAAGGLTSSQVGGWTVHPYGPNPAAKLNNLLSQTAAAGFSSSIPVNVTEVGIASAECSAGTGRSLSGDNHGWPTNLNYSTAASDLAGATSTIRSTLGSRLGVVVLYGSKDGRAPCDATAGTESYYGCLKSDLSDKGAFSATCRDEIANH